MINFQPLAEKLIAAESESERKSLLKNVSGEDSPKLAVAIKEICYSFWTSEPVKARGSARALRSLYRLSQREEIRAYLEWISGIAEITRGRLVSATEKLNESADAFLRLGKEHEAAQTQVAELYALAMLGDYAKAIEIGKKALNIFGKYGDELAAGKIEKNLGNIVSRHERHLQAEEFYLSAHKKFTKLENSEELTMVENGLAITYSALNNFKKAEKFYNRALSRARQAEKLLTQAEIEASIGNLALFRGKLDQALKFSELSRRKYETLQMPHQTAIARLEIADVYLELNLTTEAFAVYETLIGRLRKLKLQGEEARARANFGRAAATLNKIRTARSELKKAARLYLLEKNPVGAAAVKLNEAKIELDRRNYRKVLQLAQEVQALLGQSDNKRYLLTARWLQAEALRNSGEPAAAQKLLSEIFDESIKQEQPQLAQAAQNSLGKIAAVANDYARAKKHFRRAVKLIETLRAPLAAEEWRMAFLADKLQPFAELAKIYLAEKKFRQAFLMIETARSRSLAESLNRAHQKTDAEQNPVSAKLHREAEALREELNWFYSRIKRANAAELKNLQREARKREKKLIDVQRQIASTDRETFSERRFPNLPQLQNKIGEKNALLEFVNFDGTISAFIVTDKKINFVANLATESEIFELLEGLHFQFGSLRYGAEFLQSFMSELKNRARFYLQKLYEKLFQPLEKLFVERDLIIVPVGALHYVPFHALFDGAQYQIEEREIIYAPSATVWYYLASKPVRQLEKALLLGFADEKTPLVGHEIESLKQLFPASPSFFGDQATFAAFTKNAAQCDVLHLACHGQFRSDNPLFSNLQLADGFITVKDVGAQTLKAEIVTLSACETGLHKILAGEEIIGLARGFISAGANSLILSLWTVNDEATTDLMKTFYTELTKGSAASTALRTAQRRFIKNESHPYFWAPFVLIGR